MSSIQLSPNYHVTRHYLIYVTVFIYIRVIVDISKKLPGKKLFYAANTPKTKQAQKGVRETKIMAAGEQHYHQIEWNG